MSYADCFKEINDTYGHSEGDNALVRVANVLRQVASNYNCSIYRFGGDEFIMLAHADNDEDAEKIREDITNVMNANNIENQSPYTLSLSVGYAKYTSNITTIPDYISKADAQLYEIKKNRPKR